MKEIAQRVIDAIHIEVRRGLLQQRPPVAVEHLPPVVTMSPKQVRYFRSPYPTVQGVLMEVVPLVQKGPIDDMREGGVANVVKEASDLFVQGAAECSQAKHDPDGVVVARQIASLLDEIAGPTLMNSLQASNRWRGEEVPQYHIPDPVVPEDRITNDHGIGEWLDGDPP